MQGFAIELKLCSMVREGLEAIDFCRAWGIPESAYLHAYSCIRFPVEDETFLRTWFGRNDMTQLAIIKVDWLVPGELVIGSGGTVTVNPHMPIDRVKDLFVRGRFAALETSLEKAERLLAEASGAAEEES